MRVRVQEIMVDCHDPASLARFWAELMDCRRGSINDQLAVVDADPLRLAFQRVPESKQTKNRLHLDVQVSDADEACARAIKLGGQPTGQRELDAHGDGYVVMRDLEGNEFCFVVDNSGAWEQLATKALEHDHPAGRRALLADVPELIRPIGLMRWREWSGPSEPMDPEWWIAVTRDEAGREGLPITLVAYDETGAATGAVGLKEFDLPEIDDRSPWIIGMIVAADQRGRGIGRNLIEGIEEIAENQGHRRLWVATERATGFYQRCGYQLIETLRIGSDLKYILCKDFA